MDQGDYDSTLDTMRHSRRVDQLLLQVIAALQDRVTRHDLSKMEPPEKAVFDRITPLLVAGGAVLQVVVRAPAYDANGRSTVPWGGTAVVIRPDQFDTGGFRTFEDLVWGGSFEGQSSFGLGVRARLPFRVLQLDGPGAGTRLVIDVAHRW